MASGDLFADVDIGNDAGCCLGVYLKDRRRDGDDDFGEGFGKGVIPSMLLEPSVRFVAIYQGKRRMGLILLFLAARPGRPDPGLQFHPGSPVVSSRRLGRWWMRRWSGSNGSVRLSHPAVGDGDTDYNTGLTHGRLGEQGTVPVAKVFIPFFTESYRIHADIFQGVKDFRGADVEGFSGSRSPPVRATARATFSPSSAPAVGLSWRSPDPPPIKRLSAGGPRLGG